MVQFNRHAILLNRMPGFKYYLNNTLKINICYGTWDSTTNKNFPRNIFDSRFDSNSNLHVIINPIHIIFMDIWVCPIAT